MKKNVMMFLVCLTIVSVVSLTEANDGLNTTTSGIVQETQNAVPDSTYKSGIVQNSPNPPQNNTKQKRSWWDAILSLFKISEPKRTTEQAFDDMLKNQNVVVDFSHVTDFAQNGDAKMAEYYDKLSSTQSFGTKSPNLYINLSNTGVGLDFISKWSLQFKNDKKNVIWNLSENKNLDDSVIDALDCSSIYSLNLSGTSITDSGIAKISSILDANGIGNLVCIHLTSTKVTDAGVASLKTSIQKAVEVWKTTHLGQEYNLQGTDNSGVIYEKIALSPSINSQKNMKKQIINNNNVQQSISQQSVSQQSLPQQEVSHMNEQINQDELLQTSPSISAESGISSDPDINIQANNVQQGVHQSDVDSMSEMGDMQLENNAASSTIPETMPENNKSIEEQANVALNDASNLISNSQLDDISK